MVTYVGKSILKGIAVGKILFYEKEEQMVQRRSVEDAEHELARYEKAREAAQAELAQLYERALKEVGELNAGIFDVQSMMLDDEDFNDAVRNMMEAQKVNAEYAVAVTGDNFAKMFSEMDDEYFKARSADIKDASERVVKLLHGKGEEWSIGDEPVILAAKDLAPSETVQMDKSKLLGFVTELGSRQLTHGHPGPHHEYPGAHRRAGEAGDERKDGGYRRRGGDLLCGSGRGHAGGLPGEA